MNIRTPAITGDIILISQPKKNFNLIMQSVIRFGIAKHSHVAVALYNFSLIHAMPKSGVHIESLGEYLNKNKNFVVYRNKAILETKPELLATHLQYHNLQSYSLLNLLFTSWRHSFCSELAAKAYQKSGLRLTQNHRKPKQVLPIDIYRHISNAPDWIDITDAYKDFFLDNEHLAFMDKVANFERRHVNFTQSMGYGQQVLANRVNSVADGLDDNETTITPPMNYWSNQLVNRSRFSRFLFVLSYWGQMTKEMVQLLWDYLTGSRK